MMNRDAVRKLARLRSRTLNRWKNIDFTSASAAYSEYGNSMGRDYVTFHCPDPFSELTPLGQGNFSQVYELTETLVLKITKRGMDSGYERFLAVALQHQDNPHFPRVFYRGVWGHRYVYVLERLERVGDDWGSSDPEVNNWIKTMEIPPNPLIQFTCPKFAEAHAIMHADGDVMLNDLYPRNIMRRHDGTYVMTDPTC